MPKCSYCLEKGLDCSVSGTSKRCGPCNLFNRPSCDVWGIDPGAFRAFVAEKSKLDLEEEETLAKLLRLRKQKRALEERVQKAVSRELRDISEVAQEEASSSSGPPSSADVPPVSSSGVDSSLFDPAWVQGSSDDLFLAGVDLSAGPFLVGPGSSGGTPEASRGS
jgi:hypothetical protein